MIVGHIGGSSSGGYEIQKSLRFRASASAYLSRTPTVSGNRKTWTWSGWVKAGRTDSIRLVFGAYLNGNNTMGFLFNGGRLFYDSYQTSLQGTFTTNAVFRDFSAWYHVVFLVDTTQATAANRTRLFINGVEQTFSAVTYPTQNTDLFINSANPHHIGSTNGTSNYFDGYLAEVNFIDGQALDPSYFGQFSAETGAWIPKKYTGTYGTNGFYLPLNDGSNLTNLTADRSGNGNNWTANNISLTPGATYDWMYDTPTMWADGGNGRGNYCVVSPIDKATNIAVAQGNLNATNSGGASWASARCSIAVSSGKWYWEIDESYTSGGPLIMGIADASFNPFTQRAGDTSGSYVLAIDGNKGNNGSFVGYAGAAIPSGRNIGVALDLDAGTLVFYNNGVSLGTAYSGIVGTFAPVFSIYGTQGGTLNFNFGQRPFAYTPPAGFKALCTKNLPTPSILNPKKHFDVLTNTGANIKSALEALYTDQALMVVKDRANANNWQWFNDVTGLNAILQSNTTSAETTYSVPTGSSVGYGWKAGGAPVTNNAGSIQSQVSANPQAGFSIVTYTGTGANATVGHGLGAAPKMVIVKNRQTGNNWRAWHVGLNVAAPSLYLNAVNAQMSDTSIFNGTNPTASVVHLGNHSDTNAINTYVAYCFAEIPGFSKIGSYTGNGSTDGPFVYCGFRPAFVMVKRSDSAGTWYLVDNKRNGTNSVQGLLYPNLSNAEATINWDILSNGFKMRDSGADLNASGGTYIFMAFAEAPFKYSNAR